MKKGIVFIAFVIVLGVAGMPVLNGMIVEKRVRQSFEDLNLKGMASGSGMGLQGLQQLQALKRINGSWILSTRN